MKRILALLLTLALVFSLAACGKNDTTSDSSGETSGQVQTETSETDDTSADEATSTTESSGEDSTSTPTDTSKPSDTSKPVDSSTPTTSTPSTTTPSTTTHTHTWGSWETTTMAMIGKAGKQKRTCKTCSASETRDTTEGELENSFGDESLKLLIHDYLEGYVPTITHGKNMIRYYQHYGCYNGYGETTKEFSFTELYQILAKHFQITGQTAPEMSASPMYNESTNTFQVEFKGNSEGHCELEVLEYVHDGENKYTVKYRYTRLYDDKFSETIWTVNLEYNRANGGVNKYRTFTKGDTIVKPY